MERKIGEIFENNGEWYQCVEGNGCENCAFKGRKCYLKGGTDDPIGECCYDRRRDNKDVIFKKLEKAGEPIIIKGKKVQLLKSLTIGNNCCYCCFLDNSKCLISKEKHLLNTFYVEIKQTKEDMEEKKVNLKPFDLQKAKAGKPVCTRDGRKARIICFDRISGNDYYKIVACVTAFDGDFEEVLSYGIDGYIVDSQNPKDEDLMMLPEKKEGWVNIYNADTTFYYVDGRVFETKDEAVQEAKEEVEKEQREKNEYIDTIRVEWEE